MRARRSSRRASRASPRAETSRHLELGALRHVPSLWAECVRGVVDDARAEAAAVELEAEEAALLAQGALPGVAFRVVGRRPC